MSVLQFEENPTLLDLNLTIDAYFFVINDFEEKLEKEHCPYLEKRITALNSAVCPYLIQREELLDAQGAV
tara:strand:- start:1315 stop:1524 length:210 start_codon:yes stop_codon:yes gene_type:complete